jgi:hypothetical protein
LTIRSDEGLVTGAGRNRPPVSHSNLGSIIAAELNKQSILTPVGGAWHPSVSIRVGDNVQNLSHFQD